MYSQDFGDFSDKRNAGYGSTAPRSATNESLSAANVGLVEQAPSVASDRVGLTPRLVFRRR